MSLQSLYDSVSANAGPKGDSSSPVKKRRHVTAKNYGGYF